MIKAIMTSTAMWFSLAVMFPLYAQEQAPTLGSLWPRVKENYPGIGAKRAAVDAADYNTRAVKSAMLPQVNAQAQNTYGTYEGTPGTFFPQAGLFNVSGFPGSSDGSPAAANTFGSATVEWELFSFGKLRKQHEAARMRYDKAVSEQDAYLLHLKKTLSERYINLLYDDAKLKWTKKNAERLDNIREITSGLSAAGLRPAADSLLAYSTYIQAMGEYDKWQGYKTAALAKVLELYGSDTVYLSASAERFIKPRAIRLTNSGPISDAHPVLDVLEKEADYYSASGEAQQRSALPSLSLLGGYAYRGTGIKSDGTASRAWKDGFGNGTNNVLVGIGITWNITSLHTSRLKGKGLRKEAESTRFLHSQYKLAMRTDLSASEAKIRQQYQQLSKTELAVDQSRSAYEMYLARYQGGLIALTELLQIRSLLELAEEKHIEASRDYWMLLAHQAELTSDFDFLFNNL